MDCWGHSDGLLMRVDILDGVVDRERCCRLTIRYFSMF